MKRYVIVVAFPANDYWPSQVIDAGTDKHRAEMLRRSVYMDAVKQNSMPGHRVHTKVMEVEQP